MNSSSSHIAADRVTEYALGTLPASELNSMRAHFMLCATCREQLRQASMSLAAYGSVTSQGRASSTAGEHFSQRLPLTQQVRLAPTTHNIRTYFASHFNGYKAWLKTGRWIAYLAAALATALFWVGITNYRLSTGLRMMNAQAHQGELDSARLNELLDLLTSTNMKRVELRETPSVGIQPEGHITYSSRNGRLLFTASSLHTLPVEKTYQLWVLLVGDHPPISAGTFTPDNSGNASLIPPLLPAHLTIRTFAITIEDRTGATTPTLPYELSGE